jgi:AraC-like DNA-binding protein
VTIPLQRFRFATASVEEAFELVGRNYVGIRPERGAAPARGPGLRVSGAVGGRLAVDRVTNSGIRTVSAADVFDQMVVATFLGGGKRYEFPRLGELACARGSSLMFPDDQPSRWHWDDFDLLLVRLPWQDLRRAGAALTGIEAADLRFRGGPALAQARWWQPIAGLVHRELTAPDSTARDPLVNQELINTVVAAVLVSFPNTALTRGYVPGPGDVRPAAVRRAVAFIDAHASLPLTASDIADAAGTTPRALRAGFRRHLDTTPSAYLRRVRLAAVHADLQAADPGSGATVAQIALRWGFRNPARLAVEYRQAYGQPPERTLID